MNERPIIKLTRTRSELLLDLLGIAAIVASTVYFFLCWSDMPQSIPIHFNSTGQADGWGSKYIVILLPIIGLLLYIGLILIRKKPYPVSCLLSSSKYNS